MGKSYIKDFFKDGRDLRDVIKFSDVKILIHLMGALTARLWSSIIGNGVVNFKLFIKSSGFIKAYTFTALLYFIFIKAPSPSGQGKRTQFYWQ